MKLSHKMKEDEKHERVIRGLLKLPENRRCINCNSMGPQYVCTTFWTFICINCSGIHREFTHRVKSVSMAKFTPDEVSALQAGGNERARQVYFKEWDPHRNYQPDGSNLYKLRDFIKHVYVDRRFTGEKGTEKPVLRLTDKEDYSESRRSNSSRIVMTSPSYDNRSDWRYSSRMSSPSGRSDDGIERYYYDESRSPGYTRQSSRYRRSPARFEIVDDRFRDDDYGGGRRYSNGARLKSEDFKYVGRRSTDGVQKNLELPPSSLEERLERQLSARLREMNEGKEAQGSSNVQKVPSPPSQSTPSNDNEAKEEKAASPENSADPEDGSKPPDVQTQEIPPPTAATSTDATAAATASDDKTDWAAFGSSEEEKKAPTRPSDPNSVEFLLFELAGPLALPAPSNNEEVGGMLDQPKTEHNVASTTEPQPVEAPLSLPEPETVDAPKAEPCPDASIQQPVEAPLSFPEPETTDVPNVPNAESCPDASIQQPVEESPEVASDDGADLMQNPTAQQQQQPPTFAPPGNISSTQPVPSEPAPPVETKIQEEPSTAVYPAQDIAKPKPESRPLRASQSPDQPEPKLDGRKELPADLFTALYPRAPVPVPVPVPAWQPAPSQIYGFNMQYYPHNATQQGAYSNSQRSTNPFDVGGNAAEPRGPSFPPAAPLQGSVFNHNMSAPAGPFSLGNHSPYVAPIQPQPPSHMQPFPPGAYMGQQHGYGTMPFSSLQQQQQGSYESFRGNTNHQMTMGYPGANAPNNSPYSSSMGGGNPFS